MVLRRAATAVAAVLAIIYLLALSLTFATWSSLFISEEEEIRRRSSGEPKKDSPRAAAGADLVASRSRRRDDDAAVGRVRRPSRAYTPPPFPFPDRKTFWTHRGRLERPPVVDAFLSRGFERSIGHSDAAFLWFFKVKGGGGSSDVDPPWIASRSKPWQRPNFVPGGLHMAQKDPFLEVLERQKIELPFFPESYRLCGGKDGRERFLRRLTVGGGMDDAWVMKVSNSGRSAGIAMIGPNSPELVEVRADLGSPWASKRFCRGRQIVQRYVTNLLTYQGRKCHLRAFFPVVSVNDPLLVYYHDGYLHTSFHRYNETDFGKDAAEGHFSTTIREWDISDPSALSPDKRRQIMDAEVGYEDFGRYLETYVDEEAPHLREDVPPGWNPLDHVRNRMKSQMATLVEAFRDVSFAMPPSRNDFPPENAFVLIGNDYFVDKNLDVIFIESNWFAGVNKTICPAVNRTINRVLPEMVDLITEVYEKQLRGEEVLPLERLNRFELVYSDA